MRNTPPDDGLFQAELDRFQRELSMASIHVSPSLTYRMSALAVTGVTLLLPVLYAGLVLALGGYVLTVDLEHFQAIEHGAGMDLGRYSTRLFYVSKAAALVTAFFLVKPIAFRRPRPSRSRTPARADQVRLRAYVGSVAAAVGAPRPTRIDLDMEANASAAHVGPLFRRNRELVLTLGMPLLAGLSLRQLTAVLAHELGHFNQDGAFRLSRLSEGIGGWFARLARHRDGLDEMLADAAGRGFAITLVFAWITVLFVGMARLVLLLFAFAGSLLGLRLVRETEFNADEYAIRVVGSSVFKAMASTLPVIALAAYRARLDDMKARAEGKALTDLPARIESHLEAIRQDPDAISRARVVAAQDQDGLLDTHPPEHRRFRRADLIAAPTRDIPKAPARWLLRDYEALCRAVTRSDHNDSAWALPSARASCP